MSQGVSTRSDVSGSDSTARADEDDAGEGESYVDCAESRYLIEAEHARGGMGRVMRAVDRRLGRRVAIKQRLPGGTSGVRFEREARLTANLQHPAIVPVYDAGYFSTGEPFYAMKFVEGVTLRARLRAAESFEERARLLPNFIAVTDAVAYAHDQGVIHRDLKPSNIILGEHGETFVADWGMARATTSPDTAVGEGTPVPLGSTDLLRGDLTRAGALIGTPQYMAPEQARGERATERADVYALGTILAQIITGRIPHGETTGTTMIKKLLTGTPAVIDAPYAPPELVAIVRKAMSPDATLRYANAGELAADLKRFQAGQLVRAAEYTFRHHVLRWLKRHRTTLSVASVALVALAVLGVMSIERVRAERNTAERERNEAAAAGAALREKNEELLLSNARNSLSRDPTATLAWLKQVKSASTQVIDVAAAAAGRARALLAGRPHPNVVHAIYNPTGSDLVFLAYPGKVSVLDTARMSSRTVSFSSELPVLAAAEQESLLFFPAQTGGLLEYNFKSGELAQTLDTPHLVSALAASRDGRYVLMSLANGDLWRRDRKARTTTELLRGRASSELALVGWRNTAAICTASGELVVWHERTQALHGSCVPGVGIGLTETGNLIWARSGHSVRVHNLATGVERELELPDVASLVMSANGELLVTASRDGLVQAWRLSTLQSVGRHQHRMATQKLAAAPDGSAFASADMSGAILHSDVETTRAVEVSGHRFGVACLSYAPRGEGLLSADQNGEVRLWALPTRPLASISHADGPVYSVRFRDDQSVVTTGSDHTVRITNLENSATTVATGHERLVFAVTFAQDGRFATASWDATVRLWSHDGSPIGVLAGLRGSVRDASFSSDGALISAAGSDQEVMVWRTDQPSPVAPAHVLRGHDDVVGHVRFLDDHWLVSVGLDGQVLLWDLETERPQVLARTSPIIGFSQVGNQVLVGAQKGEVLLIKIALPARGTGGTPSATVRELASHEKRVTTVSLSPDGKSAASASMDGTLHVVDVVTGRVQRWPVQGSFGTSTAFGPDSKKLAVGSEDGNVRVFDLATEKLSVLPAHIGRVWNVAFSPGGRLLGTAGSDSVAHVWTVAGVMNRATPTDPQQFHGWLRQQTTVVVADNNNVLSVIDTTKELPYGKPSRGKAIK